jgi:ABC-type transporter Mla maintaining outer membrane lipid asymmetry ATPase subunit MlaF
MLGVHKHYQALRPLRIAALSIVSGERVAISGLDAAAAEVLTNLITGATLPEEGEVRVSGTPTAAISSGDDWLASLDRFGIVSARGVLLDGVSLAQNLAVPFTLALDALSGDIRRRVESLAAEAGIPSNALETRLGDVGPDLRARVHLARGLALDPALLLLEHASAALPPESRVPFGADVARAADSRRIGLLALTEDRAFAAAAATRLLRLDAASGALRPWRRWL